MTDDDHMSARTNRHVIGNLLRPHSTSPSDPPLARFLTEVVLPGLADLPYDRQQDEHTPRPPTITDRLGHLEDHVTRLQADLHNVRSTVHAYTRQVIATAILGPDTAADLEHDITPDAS